jgi:hypothetical protein
MSTNGNATAPSWLTGSPFMRALPLDFPSDTNVVSLMTEVLLDGPKK